MIFSVQLIQRVDARTRRVISLAFIMLMLPSLAIQLPPANSQITPKERVHSVLGMTPAKNLAINILGETSTKAIIQFHLDNLAQYGTARNFNLDVIYASLVSLRVLEQDIPNERELVSLLKSNQRFDGGFAASLKSNNSYLGATLPSLISLGMLGEEPENIVALISYLKHWKEFAYVDPEIAIIPLYYVGYEFSKSDLDLISRKLGSVQQPDGGFPCLSCLKNQSSVSETFTNIAALYLLGMSPKNPEAAAEFLRDSQTDSGGFAQRPGDPRQTKWFTYCSVMALVMLNSTPRNTNAALDYLRSLSSTKDFYYSDIAALKALSSMSGAESAAQRWNEIMLLSMIAVFSVSVPYLLTRLRKRPLESLG